MPSQLLYFRQKDAWSTWSCQNMQAPFCYNPKTLGLSWVHPLGTAICYDSATVQSDIDPANIAQVVYFPVEWRAPYLGLNPGHAIQLKGVHVTLWGKELGATAQLDKVGGVANFADYQNLSNDAIAFFDVTWLEPYFQTLASLSKVIFPTAIGSTQKTYFRDLWAGCGVVGKVISPILYLKETASTQIRRLEIFCMKIIVEDGGIF